MYRYTGNSCPKVAALLDSGIRTIGYFSLWGEAKPLNFAWASLQVYKLTG
jgi:hypothetical protein